MSKAWICPKCGRPFKYETSYHSCVKVDVNSFTKGKPPKVIKAFNKIVKSVQKLDDALISASKSAIYAKAPSTFLSLKLMKDRLVVEFFLPKPTDEFPIYKIFPLTKTRIVHYVAVEDESEVNEQLLGWIRESYRLITKK